MIKTAITGNIAGGKSQVEKIIMGEGYKVIDTDKINRYILAYDVNAAKEIKMAFLYDDIVDENGSISRQKLGNLVFSSPEKRLKLEQILHNKILLKVNEFIKENENEKIIFISVPLLFEKGWDKYFDKIIFVYADEDIRLKRLMARNNLTEEQALLRINSQLKDTEKLVKSDFVIYNNSDFISLRDKTKTVLNSLISR